MARGNTDDSGINDNRDSGNIKPVKAETITVENPTSRKYSVEVSIDKEFVFLPQTKTQVEKEYLVIIQKYNEANLSPLRLT